MSDEHRKAAARLAHDVGKHVARAARNIGEGAVPPAVLGMLARDLYELRPGERASVVFEERASALDALADVRLSRVRTLLGEADRLEAPLRAGEPRAVRRGAAIALEVEALLREVAADLGGRP